MLRREYNAANPMPGGFPSSRGKPAGGGPSSPSGGGGSDPRRRGGETPPIQPAPAQSTCFTIVGMDLMVDDELEPWIIEINHLPSFRWDSESGKVTLSLVGLKYIVEQ